MLEDRHGAIAYGCVAPRVFYARFVGSLSGPLGKSFAEQLRQAAGELGKLAYFADESALAECDVGARARLARLLGELRARLTSVVILSRQDGNGPSSRTIVKAAGAPIEMLTEPIEFERALCNVAPFPDRSAKNWAHVWQVHTPRQTG